MADPGADPSIRRLRCEISAVDRAILDALNRRLELVAELKRYKASRGIGFVDPEREREILAELASANGGPLSDEGLSELFARLLELTKREVARIEASTG